MKLQLYVPINVKKGKRIERKKETAAQHLESSRTIDKKNKCIENLKKKRNIKRNESISLSADILKVKVNKQIKK